MFGSNALEVTTGLIFVFILVSIICTAIREGIESFLKTRAAYLEHGIRQLLNDKEGKGIANDFFNHPLIFGLFNDDYTPGKNQVTPSILQRGGNLPSYIPSKNFALALMDIAARGPVDNNADTTIGSPVISLESIRKNAADLNNPYLQRVIVNAVDNAQGDINKVQASLEAWYNSSMDRVSGWYKRSTQWILLVIGIVIAVGLNINCIKIADFLSRNEAARKVIVERVGVVAKDSTASSMNYQQAKKDLRELDLPMGWANGWDSAKVSEKKDGPWNNLFGPILGWLIIAFAATLGAPFWFDMLNKVMVIRSTVKPHQKSEEEASQDKQAPPSHVVYVNAPAATQVAPQANATDEDMDGCDITTTKLTADENLPASKGGIA